MMKRVLSVLLMVLAAVLLLNSSAFCLVKGKVVRYELPNLGALNFLLYEALDGGGTVSLRTDAQGKTYGAALLRMEIEVDER